MNYLRDYRNSFQGYRIFRLREILLLLLMQVSLLPVNAQLPLWEKDIKTELLKSTTPAARNQNLLKLSEFYYAIKEEASADSVIEKMIYEAEESRDDHLLEIALFQNPAFLIQNPQIFSVADKKLRYINRAMSYARRTNRMDLLAYAQIQLSSYYQMQGELANAATYADLANSNAIHSENDTAIIQSLLQQGFVNQATSQSLIAMQKFSAAYNWAQDKKLPGLESKVLYALAQFYKSKNDKPTGRSHVFKSLKQNEQLKNPSGLMHDYLNLALMCNNDDIQCLRESLANAIRLADSLKNPLVKLEASKILFYSLYENVDAQKMFDVLHKDEDLKQYFYKIAPGNKELLQAQIFLYDVKHQWPDSAVYYLEKARDSVFTTSVMIRKKSFMTELAFAYVKTNPSAAIEAWKSVLVLEEQTDNLRGMANATQYLKNLYKDRADYKNAFLYSDLHEQYTEQLSARLKEDELAMLAFDNQQKDQKRAETEAMELKRRQFNLQYMLIGALVIAFFIGLAMMGVYQVSQVTLRVMGFFSFLMLFEFITLLSKNWIKQFTHGVPWQDLLFMMALAAVMLPLHHWVEHKVINYFSKKNMLRGKFFSAQIDNAPEKMETPAKKEEEVITPSSPTKSKLFD